VYNEIVPTLPAILLILIFLHFMDFHICLPVYLVLAPIHIIVELLLSHSSFTCFGVIDDLYRLCFSDSLWLKDVK
jgi:hypothetical protein